MGQLDDPTHNNPGSRRTRSPVSTTLPVSKHNVVTILTGAPDQSKGKFIAVHEDQSVGLVHVYGIPDQHTAVEFSRLIQNRCRDALEIRILDCGDQKALRIANSNRELDLTNEAFSPIANELPSLQLLRDVVVSHLYSNKKFQDIDYDAVEVCRSIGGVVVTGAASEGVAREIQALLFDVAKIPGLEPNCSFRTPICAAPNGPWNVSLSCFLPGERRNLSTSSSFVLPPLNKFQQMTVYMPTKIALRLDVENLHELQIGLDRAKARLNKSGINLPEIFIDAQNPAADDIQMKIGECSAIFYLGSSDSSTFDVLGLLTQIERFVADYQMAGDAKYKSVANGATLVFATQNVREHGLFADLSPKKIAAEARAASNDESAQFNEAFKKALPELAKLSPQRLCTLLISLGKQFLKEAVFAHDWQYAAALTLFGPSHALPHPRVRALLAETLQVRYVGAPPRFYFLKESLCERIMREYKHGQLSSSLHLHVHLFEALAGQPLLTVGRPVGAAQSELINTVKIISGRKSLTTNEANLYRIFLHNPYKQSAVQEFISEISSEADYDETGLGLVRSCGKELLAGGIHKEQKDKVLVYVLECLRKAENTTFVIPLISLCGLATAPLPQRRMLVAAVSKGMETLLKGDSLRWSRSISLWRVAEMLGMTEEDFQIQETVKKLAKGLLTKISTRLHQDETIQCQHLFLDLYRYFGAFTLSKNELNFLFDERLYPASRAKLERQVEKIKRASKQVLRGEHAKGNPQHSLYYGEFGKFALAIDRARPMFLEYPLDTRTRRWERLAELLRDPVDEGAVVRRREIALLLLDPSTISMLPQFSYAQLLLQLTDDLGFLPKVIEAPLTAESPAIFWEKFGFAGAGFFAIHTLRAGLREAQLGRVDRYETAINKVHIAGHGERRERRRLLALLENASDADPAALARAHRRLGLNLFKSDIVRGADQIELPLQDHDDLLEQIDTHFKMGLRSSSGTSLVNQSLGLHLQSETCRTLLEPRTFLGDEHMSAVEEVFDTVLRQWHHSYCSTTWHSVKERITFISNYTQGLAEGLRFANIYGRKFRQNFHCDEIFATAEKSWGEMEQFFRQSTNKNLRSTLKKNKSSFVDFRYNYYCGRGDLHRARDALLELKRPSKEQQTRLDEIQNKLS